MRIKTEALDASTNDFWYDLTDGGYLKPTELLDDPADAKRVLDAIGVLLQFRTACEEQIGEDFYR